MGRFFNIVYQFSQEQKTLDPGVHPSSYLHKFLHPTKRGPLFLPEENVEIHVGWPRVSAHVKLVDWFDWVRPS